MKASLQLAKQNFDDSRSRLFWSVFGIAVKFGALFTAYKTYYYLKSVIPKFYKSWGSYDFPPNVAPPARAHLAEAAYQKMRTQAPYKSHTDMRQHTNASIGEIRGSVLDNALTAAEFRYRVAPVRHVAEHYENAFNYMNANQVNMLVRLTAFNKMDDLHNLAFLAGQTSERLMNRQEHLMHPLEETELRQLVLARICFTPQFLFYPDLTIQEQHSIAGRLLFHMRARQLPYWAKALVINLFTNHCLVRTPAMEVVVKPYQTLCVGEGLPEIEQ